MQESSGVDYRDDKFWDERSENYHQLKWVSDSTVLNWIDRHIRATAKHNKAERVLEIGCGNGALTRHLKDAQEDGVFESLHVCDKSSKMVELCRKKVPGVQAQATGWETMGRGWDMIVCRMVLRHLNGPEAVVSAWMDMLCPGGSLIVIEGPPPRSAESESTKLYDAAMAMKHGSWRSTLHSHSIGQMMFDAGAVEVQQFERFSNSHSIREWLEAAKVDPVVTERIIRLHRVAKLGAVEDYKMEMGQDDVATRWRHAVVIGKKPQT